MLKQGQEVCSDWLLSHYPVQRIRWPISDPIFRAHPIAYYPNDNGGSFFHPEPGFIEELVCWHGWVAVPVNENWVDYVPPRPMEKEEGECGTGCEGDVDGF